MTKLIKIMSSVSQMTGWDPLTYLMSDIHKLGNRPCSNFTGIIFPESCRGKVTTERQGQPNLGASVANREDRLLFGKITDQPKIRWAINNQHQPMKLLLHYCSKELTP
jgi:hypothetical protein